LSGRVCRRNAFLPGANLKDPMFLSALLLSTFLLCGPNDFFGFAPAPGEREEKGVVCPDGPTLDGIDVSYWQGTIDWDAVSDDGIVFAFIRAADGLFEDPKFEENWGEARRVGIIRGAYQYFRPGIDATEQANLLLRKIGRLRPGDLPPVLDVETTDGENSEAIVAGIRTWINAVEARTGRRPLIYTAKYFWRDHVGSGEFVDYPLWVANWQVDCPSLPPPWTRWVFWQTSSSGHVAGISTRVDTDLFNGDMEDLLEFSEARDVCGDGFCTGDETPDTCPEDCPRCDPVPPQGRIIDETDICFEKSGTPEYWHTENAGWQGSLLWTYAWDPAEPDNVGVWRLDIAEAGRYRVDVYTASPWAQSRKTIYEIFHAGTLTRVPLDQSRAHGWRLLGRFEFAAGANQWIRLEDNTGESYEERRRIVFDAVRLTRIEPPKVFVFTGDANSSSQVDIADAVCVLEYLFAIAGGPCKRPDCMANMDANGDGFLDLADAVSILSFLFSSGTMRAPDGTVIEHGGTACRSYPKANVTLDCARPCAE